MNRVTTILRMILGQIFILAAFDKILNPQQFADIITNYHILPESLVNFTAIFLPWLEMVCGAALMFNFLPAGAAITVWAMMMVFIGAQSYNIYRGLDVSCGCFTTNPEAEPAVLLSLIRDSAIALLALVVVWTTRSKKR